MAKDFSTMEDSNRSSNPSIHDVSDPARRTLLRGGLVGTVTGLLAPLSGVAALAGCATVGGGAPLLGFKSVPVSTADTVVVPEGYTAQFIAAWGEPVGLSGENAAFKFDASNSAAEQETQIGMHHDGIHFFKHPITPESSSTGLLAMNHEYADDGLLHTDGMATWNAAKVRKAQAAHGVAVIEVEAKDGQWNVVRPSPWARRITASTPMAFGGPAAGHALVQTQADPRGVRPLGTLNNCGSGITPWGTYLTCEENFIFYFNGGDTPSAHERRWGLRKGGVGYRWHEHDERFDATKHEVRVPAVAGLFYPEQPAALRGMVQGFLQDVDEPQQTPKALIAPHAGFEYSGAIAGAAFRQLAAARDLITRVVLAGPSHRVPFQGIALCSAQRFATPLGEVPVDEEAQARIAGHPDVVALDVAHAEEHSLETHLPFLQLALGRFSIVPLVVGDANPRDVARVFETLWGGPETLICVSSDLSHYLSYEAARRRDAETTRAIEALNPDALDYNQACGRTGIQALLICAKKHGLKAITLDQRNSGDTAGSRDRVVGYGAYAFV